MKILLFVCLAAEATLAAINSEKHPCDGVECRAGRECVALDGTAQCLCAVSCPQHLKPVCGSNDQTYDNHCMLHRDACLTGVHIRIYHKGNCKKSHPNKQTIRDEQNALLSKFELQDKLEKELLKDFKEEVAIEERKVKEKEPVEKKINPPAVCYAPQRDAMRFLLVSQWEATLRHQPWFLEGMTFKESLWGWFYTCDDSKDNYLTPEEFLSCANNTTFYPRPGQDKKLTKSLCIDALVDDGDTNNDWKLDFEEFTKIMDANYRPKDKECTLEGKSYLDGEEVHVDCNYCICAVGNWICAAEECPVDILAESRQLQKTFKHKESKTLKNSFEGNSIKETDDKKFNDFDYLDYADEDLALGDDKVANKHDDDFYEELYENTKQKNVKKERYNWEKHVKKGVKIIHDKTKKLNKKWNLAIHDIVPDVAFQKLDVEVSDERPMPERYLEKAFGDEVHYKKKDHKKHWNKNRKIKYWHDKHRNKHSKHENSLWNDLEKSNDKHIDNFIHDEYL